MRTRAALCAWFGAVVIAALPAGATAHDVPRIRWNPGSPEDVTRGAFELTGLGASELGELANRIRDEQGASRFLVVVDRSADEPGSSLAMAGRYEVRDGVVRFTPRFRLVPGVTYLAEYRKPSADGEPLSAPIVARITLPPPRPAGATFVTRVDPTVASLPENQLKFYVHFSGPMRKGGAYKHVHLVDASGVRLELPFLELGEELWDPEARRLTLLIDPGRIKRGVKPREELGPVLVEGGKYRLSIDQDWPDSAGNPLRAAFQKEFTVGPPDNVPPDPKTWVVVAPRPGTREALAIRFPEPLDRAMLEWALSVRGSDTTGVSGRNDVSDDARSWRFVPDREWTEGEYEVHVDRTLEDLAGNSIERPFEVDSERVIERRISATTTVLRVQILAGERREPR